MELLNQIIIVRGCEPSVIISYVALVREVYLHACTNLKEKNMDTQERKAKMLEQWKQIEKHYAKIKYAMLDCWPVGNESDLMAVYVSIALLYSLYKDVCDENIIRQCYEAAERARQCGRANLSESEFSEVQQYCDTIENIFFLRRQQATQSRSRYVNNGVEQSECVQKEHQLRPVAHHQLSSATSQRYCDVDRAKLSNDGPAILAEYGRLTAAQSKRLRPSDYEIKNREKYLKQQKLHTPATLLTEFEAILTTRNINGDQNSEFPRPSELKLSRNSNNSAEEAENFDLNSDFCNQKVENSIAHTFPVSANPSEEHRSNSDQKDDPMTTVVNIGSNTNCVTSTSPRTADSGAIASATRGEVSEFKCERNGDDFPAGCVSSRLEAYVNELVEKIIHTVVGVNEESSGNGSRRNSEIIQKIDTLQSAVFTFDTDSVAQQRTVVTVNEDQAAGKRSIDKNIMICAKRIFKESIDRQVENIVTESRSTVTHIESNGADQMSHGCNDTDKKKSKLVLVESYAEMELKNDSMSENLREEHKTSEKFVDFTPSVSVSNFKSVQQLPESVTTVVLSTSADSNGQANENGKRTETDILIDALEELSRKTEKVQKIYDDDGKILTYVVREYFDSMDETADDEENEKFNKILETLQKIEGLKGQQLGTVTSPRESGSAAKVKCDFPETDSDVVPVRTIPVVLTNQKVNEKQKSDVSKYEADSLTDREGQYIATEADSPESVISSEPGKKIPGGTVINVMDGTADSQMMNQTSNQQKAPWLQKEVVTATNSGSQRSTPSDSLMQKLHYNSDMPFVELTSSFIKKLILTLEKFDARQKQFQRRPSFEKTDFESFVNFEPARCILQKIPEFDAIPLLMKPQIPEYKPHFQPVIVSNTLDNEKYGQVLESTPQDSDQLHRKHSDSENFPKRDPSNFEYIQSKNVGSTDLSKMQSEMNTELASGQRYHVSGTSRTTPSVISHPHTASKTITAQKPLITDFEISKSVTSKNKAGTEESSDISMKSIWKKTFTEKESLLAKNDQHVSDEQLRGKEMHGSNLIKPEMTQTNLSQSPSLHVMDKETVFSSKQPKPPLSDNSENSSTLREKSDTDITPADINKTNFDFSASEICQTNISHNFEPLNEFVLEKTPEIMEQPLECRQLNEAVTMGTNQNRRENGRSGSRCGAVWNLADKFSSHEESIVKDAVQAQTSAEATNTVIHIPHFDARAEFERRLSKKKKHPGEMPVIVKSAKLRSGNEKQLTHFAEDPQISSTMPLRATEKPDFNFMIKKNDNDNIASSSNNQNGVSDSHILISS